tara:strand:- start:528 stop:1091 length:564 start_codon:yes stop_codon:yes gene_type:complete
MRYLILLFLLISACSKPQSKLICGDHECVNKLEAKQYFEENLTLEVRIIDKRDKIKSYDLVQYNLSKNKNNKERNIKIFEKKTKNIKILSGKEKEKKIKEIALKEKIVKKDKKLTRLEKKKKLIKIERDNKSLTKKVDKNNVLIKKKLIKDSLDDVCSVLDTCDIDEITNLLIKKGKTKNFPDISKR